MKTLIFDFDGTIADSFGILVEVFEQITKRQAKFSAEEIERLRGLQARQILKYLKIRRWQVPRLLVLGRRAIGGQIDNIRPVSGLPRVLKQLHETGYPMLILSTNSQANIQRFLDKHQLSQYFDGVYGGVGILNKSAAIKKLIAKQKLAASDCLYIGDELRDILAARKAKINYISAGWGFNSVAALKLEKPMLLVEKPAELISAIKKLSG